MALRVYIDGYLQQHNVMRDPGVRVSRELDGYSSRAEFRLRLSAADSRPNVSEHVVVRDDIQLLRNSNRLSESSLTRSNISAPAPSWTTLPAQVGGNGLTWQIAETSAGGYLRNRTYLVEHPLDRFGAESGALETRYFAHMVFVARSATPSTTVIVTARAHNGTSADETEVEFDINDGTWVVNSGTGDVYADDADANWWRFVIVSTMTPATATAMPYVETEFQPNGTATTCCWQISELSSTSIGLTWDDASMIWDDADFTWDDTGPFGPYSNLPPYLDRRNVSANEFLGIVAEVKPSYHNNEYVFVDILAVDYRIKMRRTLVTETYSSQTDEAIITDLLSTYAPYLTPLYTGTATTSLSFTWSGKPLDECLEEVTAQTGKPWRVEPEAHLQYGPPSAEVVDWTFGDAHNLLQQSADMTKSPWASAGGGTSSDIAAIPTGGRGLVFTVGDTVSGSVHARVQSDIPNTGTSVNAAIVQPFRFYAGLYIKKGSVENRYCYIQATSGGVGPTCYVDGDTGQFLVPAYSSTPTQSGTFPSVLDDDGDEWYLCDYYWDVPFATSSVFVWAFAPAGASALGTTSASGTGNAVVFGPRLCRVTNSRYVATGAFRAYSEDNTNWNMTSSGQAIADLANIITVQNNEAGTYDHTATDDDSVDVYGEWETRIIDSSLASDAACQRRAEAELAEKAWPRESISIECWYKTNLDVGMLATVTQRHVLQSRAAGQIIQRYTLEYRNAIDQKVTLNLAPFNDDKVVKALRKALAS